MYNALVRLSIYMNILHAQDVSLYIQLIYFDSVTFYSGENIYEYLHFYNLIYDYMLRCII